MMKRLTLLITILFLLIPSGYADSDQAFDDYEKAVAAYRQDDLDLAERLLVSALKNIAPTDGYRADALQRLAHIYVSKQQYVQAEPIWKEVLSVYENRKPEPDLRGMIHAYQGLFNIYLSHPDYAQAANISESIGQLQTRVYGADSLEANSTYANLGSIYLQLGRHAEARVLFERTIPILEKAVPADDKILLIAKKNYQISKAPNVPAFSFTFEVNQWIQKGDQAFRDGQKELAIESYEQAKALIIKQQGPQSPALRLIEKKIHDVQALGSNSNYLALLDKRVIRWHNKTKIIKVHIESAQHLKHWKPEYTELVKKAFNTWEEVLNHKHIIEFVDTPTDVDVLVRWRNKPLQATKDGFKPLGLNHVELWNSYIASNDIDISLEEPIENPDFLYYVLLHETGHLMGLHGHSDNPNDVMFNYIQSDWKPITQPSVRDIATIQALYNRPADLSNPPKIRLSNFEAFRRKEEAENSAVQFIPEFTWE